MTCIVYHHPLLHSCPFISEPQINSLCLLCYLFSHCFVRDWCVFLMILFSVFPISSFSEPSRSHGGPDGRVRGEESEPSDDEMLSLSSQQSNASAAHQKPDLPAPTSATPAPTEEVDLLGLDGDEVNRPSSKPPSTAAATTDLLGDLFGGPPQSTSGPPSAQSTPHKVAPNTASPCPSPAPPGEKFEKAFPFRSNLKLDFK